MKLSASESTPEAPEGPGLPPWVFAISAPVIYRDEPNTAQLTTVNGERRRSRDRELHRLAAGPGDHRQATVFQDRALLLGLGSNEHGNLETRVRRLVPLDGQELVHANDVVTSFLSSGNHALPEGQEPINGIEAAAFDVFEEANGQRNSHRSWRMSLDYRRTRNILIDAIARKLGPLPI